MGATFGIGVRGCLSLLCLLGVILFKAIERIESRLLGWHASRRNIT